MCGKTNNIMTKKIIKGYKGFDKNLTCRGKKYEIGKTYAEAEAELCMKGMHFCENPHDVFGYYGAGYGNRFAIVESDNTSDERGDDSKRVSKALYIKSEISAFDICKIAVSAFFENFGFGKKIESADTNIAGYLGAASAGDCGAASAGYLGAASAGYLGAASAGDRGAASAGECGTTIVSNNGKVKGGIGCVLVARDLHWDSLHNCKTVTDWACAIVDGETIKADTWYHLVNGELKEVEI